MSRILTGDLTVEIDLKSAPMKTLLEIPGVDEALAKEILTKRETCRTLKEFQNKTRGSVFSKEGIQFNVGLLKRKLMKLTFQGSKLTFKKAKSVRAKNIAKQVSAKVMPVIQSSPLKRNANMNDLISKLEQNNQENQPENKLEEQLKPFSQEIPAEIDNQNHTGTEEAETEKAESSDVVPENLTGPHSSATEDQQENDVGPLCSVSEVQPDRYNLDEEEKGELDSQVEDEETTDSNEKGKGRGQPISEAQDYNEETREEMNDDNQNYLDNLQYLDAPLNSISVVVTDKTSNSDLQNNESSLISQKNTKFTEDTQDALKNRPVYRKGISKNEHENTVDERCFQEKDLFSKTTLSNQEISTDPQPKVTEKMTINSIFLELASEEDSAQQDTTDDENEFALLLPKRKPSIECSDTSEDETPPLQMRTNHDNYSESSLDFEPILEQVLSLKAPSGEVEETKVVPPISVKTLRLNAPPPKERRGYKRRNDDNRSQKHQPQRKSNNKKQKRRRELKKSQQDDDGRRRRKSQKFSDQHVTKRRKTNDTEILPNPAVSPEMKSTEEPRLDSEESITVPSRRRLSGVTMTPAPDSGKEREEGKVKKRGTEMFKFETKVESRPPRLTAHPLVRLQQRLFSGQYVKLRKLSSGMIAGQLGCSVADYLGLEDTITVSEALGDEEKRQKVLQPQAAEVEPARPRKRPRLRCALCEEEFEDFDSRVKHYHLHTSGQIGTGGSRQPTTFNCYLCSTQFGSTEERREHYLTLHSPQVINTTARIPCKQPGCTMDFESVAESIHHYLFIHKLKDSYIFPTSR